MGTKCITITEKAYTNLDVYKESKESFSDVVTTKSLHRFATIVKSMNATGDNILNSKDIKESFEQKQLLRHLPDREGIAAHCHGWGVSDIYEYSDFIFFDSNSAKEDFFKLKRDLNIQKDYRCKVIPLGSDFTKSSSPKPQEFQELLNSKYILFVGTLEPRKNQQKVLEAFELLIEKYRDLNLVFIGKQGWKVDALAQTLNTHPLKNKKLFWLQTIDDNALNHFYQNAFIVTYLSQYEGYGLPIAESLNFSNITIASKNSSMYEVGQDYADYIVHNGVDEIVDIISLYYENPELYDKKKEYIKKEYKPIGWNDMYNALKSAFDD